MGMHQRVVQPRVVYREYVQWVLCNWYVYTTEQWTMLTQPYTHMWCMGHTPYEGLTHCHTGLTHCHTGNTPGWYFGSRTLLLQASVMCV